MIEGTVSQLFQVAYVSNDFDQAKMVLGQQFGIRNYFEMRHIEVLADDGRRLNMSMALAYAGAMQFEIITPEGGDDQFYRRVLTGAKFELNFHHLGMLIADPQEYDRLLAAHAAAGNTIELTSRIGEDSRYFYADAKGVGHHLEYVNLAGAELGFFDQVPRN